MKEDVRNSSKEYEDLKGSPRNALNFLKRFLVDYLIYLSRKPNTSFVLKILLSLASAINLIALIAPVAKHVLLCA